MLISINIWAPSALLVAIVYFVYHQYQKPQLSAHLQWLGVKNEPFTLFRTFRARLHNVAHFKAALQRGYEEYALKGKACVLPTTAGDFVLLPSEDIGWIISQDDSTLSAGKPHIENLQCDYTFAHPHVIRDSIHHHVIKSDLTRQLGSLNNDIIDELANAIDLLWGTDTENWRTVHCFGTIMQIVARTSNRIFVGLPMCRDKNWLANAAGFAREVPTKSAILRKVPPVLRPIVAPFLLRKNKQHIAAFTSESAPEIVRRQQMLADAGNDEKKADLPNDLLSWLVIHSQKSPNPFNRTVKIIAGRLLAIQFAAIHTSTFSATNLIFDLISCPNSTAIIEELRAETISVLAANNNTYNKTALLSMHKIDSCLRESARLNSFLGPGLVRTVIAKEGITTPTTRTFCPYGTQIGVVTHGIHHDPANFPSPTEFQPFRFISSDNKQFQNQPPTSSTTFTPQPPPSNPISSYQTYTKTSPTYHPFGHGRHACPGRFFASNELKLLTAYIVTHYEIEPLPQRPASTWRGTVFLPPMTANIRVKRRKVIVDE